MYSEKSEQKRNTGLFCFMGFPLVRPSLEVVVLLKPFKRTFPVYMVSQQGLNLSNQEIKTG